MGSVHCTQRYFPQASASLVIVHVESQACQTDLQSAVPGMGTGLVDGGWEPAFHADLEADAAKDFPNSNLLLSEGRERMW